MDNSSAIKLDSVMSTDPLYIKGDTVLNIEDCGRLCIVIEPCVVRLQPVLGLCYNICSNTESCTLETTDNKFFIGCGGSGKKIVLSEESAINLICGDKYWFVVAIRSEKSYYID